MRLLGLTGGIASGKTTAGALLLQQPGWDGVPLIDFDIIAREIVEPGKPAYKDLLKHFPQFFTRSESGVQVLNREAMGKSIFGSSDRSQLALVNKITHPRIQREVIRRLAYYWIVGEPLVVLDIPLFFEGKYNKWLPSLLVYCSDDARMGRLMKRMSLNEEDARARMRAQMSMEEKRRLADHVIDNSGDREQLEEQVRGAATQLRMGLCARFLHSFVLSPIPLIVLVVGLLLALSRR